MDEIKGLSDKELVKAVKYGPSPDQHLKELVDRHSGIYISMVNNYSPDVKSGLLSSRADLLSDRNYYIYQAALKYDESRKTKFSTYLGNETRWLCLNIYNKNKNSKEISSDKPDLNYVAHDQQEISMKQEILDKIMTMIHRDPDRRIATIFKMRYIDGNKNKVMPWNQVCESVDLSIQGCINIHDKTIKKLKKQLETEI
jgi:DNA-directed RNA polymerase specialized sigma subunit